MLIRQTVRYLPAQILAPLSQMVAAIAWTYWLAPDALGAYAIVWAVQEFASVFVLAWWSGYVLRYASSHHGPAERARLDATEAAVQTGSAILQTVIAVLAVWLVIDVEPTLHLFLAAIAFTLTRNISSHFGDRARAQFEIVAYSILQIVGSLFGLVLGLLAVIYWEPTPEALLWSYALAQGVGLVIALPLMDMKPRLPRIDPHLIRAAIRYGVPLTVSSVLVWVATHSIRFIVQADLGIEAVGLVTVGWWLGIRLTTFASLLVTGASFSIAVEQARAGGPKNALPQLATNGALLLGVLVPSVAGVIALNQSFVQSLVAPAYVAVTVQILPWAVAAGAIRAFKNHGSDQSFLLFERTTLNVWSTIVEAAATVILCWLGLRLGGMQGAVIGCFAAAVVAECFSLVVAWRLFGYFLRPSELARIGVATAAMVALLLLFPVTHGMASLLAEVAAGAAVYGLAIALAFPELFQAIRGHAVRLAQR